MQLLSVASEVYPLIKTGGLADVAGALPLALASHGVAVTTLLPGYRSVLAKLDRPLVAAKFDDLLGTKARLLRAELGGRDLLVLEAPALFDRDGGPYADAAGLDWPDNWRRFAALSRAAADIAGGAISGYQPDLVHAHDWQAAMALVYLRHAARRVPGVLTIHNLAFQGQFPAGIFRSLGLPDDAFDVDLLEYYGNVGFLKGGLQAADAITTVSPSYAQEIRTPEFGMGLEGVINARADRLHGIVNGIDTDDWDPARDPHLARTYSAGSLPRRRENRAVLARRFGIDPGAGPLFCVISRLTGQKGMDVLVAVIDDLVAMGGSLAVLGSGEPALEAAFRAAAVRHPTRVGIVTAYDEPLSHQLQGGSDAILVPSRFEPCGLTQLCGLRYGCLPIVARTGGLADTIIDANEAALAAGVATGFQFGRLDADTLRQTIARACAVYARPEQWRAMQRQAMRADVSWTHSAARYAALFAHLIGRSG
ncbi:MAG: glgA [Sphingomonas bacterium]|nr:glgA [Sphingomonas bacterium]